MTLRKEKRDKQKKHRTIYEVHLDWLEELIYDTYQMPIGVWARVADEASVERILIDTLEDDRYIWGSISYPVSEYRR